MAELRQAEVSRRDSLHSAQTVEASSSEGIPSFGLRRQRWLRAELLRLLQEGTVVCPSAAGSSAEALLAFFENATG